MKGNLVLLLFCNQEYKEKNITRVRKENINHEGNVTDEKQVAKKKSESK